MAEHIYPHMNNGIFIVLEGSDGSGKGTQFKLLTERLKAVGYDVETFDFPRYDQPSSHFVQRYLNGDYGPASEISPYSASLFYALDRYEAAIDIRKALDSGKVVLSNRYVGSNMAHQGSKFTNPAEQRGFFIWSESLEFELLGIPRPNINLFLRVPAEVSYQLIANKNQRSYTDKKRDEHEADIEHLRKSVATYDTLCQLFPRDFKAIECTDEDRLLSVPAINNRIWEIVKPMLPEKPHRPARGAVVRFDEPAERSEPKPKAQNTPTSQPAQASPAKLSLLALIEESKSGNLDLEGLEMGAKQPEYYTPSLEPSLLKQYQAFMKQIAAYRQKVEKELAKRKSADSEEILGLLMPMATYCYLHTSKDGSKLREPKLDIKHNQAKKQLEKLAHGQTSPKISTETEVVTLLEAWPHNEFSLLSDSLYDISDLPRQQVQAGIENWNYEQKFQALSAILADIDPALAGQVRYRWDVIAEQGLILELLLSGLVSGLQLQAPTPRYGYDVPAGIEAAGLENEFIECFDLSLEMFSKLQAGKEPELAAYATLTGHRVRFQFSCNLGALQKIPKVRSKLFDSLLEQLWQNISQHHPIIADSLRRQLEDKPKQSKSARRRSNRRRSAK